MKVAVREMELKAAMQMGLTNPNRQRIGFNVEQPTKIEEMGNDKKQ